MEIQTGMILLWEGAIIDIPVGYALCDGNAGTPDLRNRFIVGAGDTYAVDASGGATTHTHGFTGDGHVHNIGPGGDISTGPNYAAQTDSEPAVGTTDAGSSLPPYYALAYIMKT